METVGVVGVGDMGSGLAKNLMAAGHKTYGFDVNAARLDAFASTGGNPVGSAAEVGSFGTRPIRLNDSPSRFFVPGVSTMSRSPQPDKDADEYQ